MDLLLELCDIRETRVAAVKSAKYEYLSTEEITTCISGNLVCRRSRETLTGRAIAGFPPRQPGFDPKSGHVGFLVDKEALGKVVSEYFGFPCQFSFHRLLHTHHLSSRAGTTGQLVADVPSGLKSVCQFCGLHHNRSVSPHLKKLSPYIHVPYSTSAFDDDVSIGTSSCFASLYVSFV
jgi:hypothetical protein